nr:hypothetical protein MS310 [uncultured bacterium]
MPDQLLRHLSIKGYAELSDFQSPNSGGREKPFIRRDVATHGQRLLRQIRDLKKHFPDVQGRRDAAGIAGATGLAIALEIKPKGAIDFKSVEWKNDGVELLTVLEAENSEIVVLYVPEGKISAIEKRVQAYLTTRRKSGKPANMTLVNAIETVRQAIFDDLWTDTAPPPAKNTAAWFQVWLRVSGQTAAEAVAQFSQSAKALRIATEPGYVRFPGRVIVAVHASRAILEQATELLDMIAEIRSVTPTAEFFLADLKPHQQNDWVQDLVARADLLDGAESNRIALLDTGVNSGHPLLENYLHPKDMHAHHPDWGHADHDGHGTEMAGLCLYGSLVAPLSSEEDIELTHRLESVKILPPTGQNAPHLYGAITRQAANRVEVEAAKSRRVFAMMTTSEGKIDGEPSEWSATVDQLAFGRAPLEIGLVDENEAEDGAQRLFVLAGGNIHWKEWAGYPDINSLSMAENPSQAWNALTVGAATRLTDLDKKKYPDLKVLASDGALSPASRTTIMWKKTWPYKPDVVAEGGNASIDAGKNITVGPESLRQLTTAANMQKTLLCETGDTSAATAEVARLCARLRYQYPDYWPETIRGLVIHGARYTPAMMQTLPKLPTQQDKFNLLRSFGYGLVDESLSSFSTQHRPTLILQETIHPLRKDGSSVKLGKMVLHDLPWPDVDLLPLGGTTVSLRVTLSYYVEPNPSKRGWQSKFRYQSHGLRFAIKAASETDDQFIERVNALERAEDDSEAHGDPDRSGWALGHQLRTRGSAHSDVWTGTAAQLAAKGQIAVYPVGGWWKDWTEAKQWNTATRYSLVLSLEVADDVAVDLYTPIETEITVVPEIDIPGAE